jgi:hypothetical protein
VHRPGLLEVEVHVVVDPPLRARLQVLDEQPASALFAPDEGQVAAVRRRGRPDRAARAAGDLHALARRHVVALDREHLLVRILRIFEDRAGGGVQRKVDGAAVMAEGRLAKFLLVLRIGPLDQSLAAAAAIGVIEPDFPGAEGALRREMLARGDEAPVGAPSRRVHERKGLVGDGASACSVRAHHPDIVPAAAVGGVSDAAAVGGEARLMLEGEAGADPPRSPAFDRQGVDVAEQVEGDGAAVGADVHIHPCAFGNVDADLAGALAGRVVDVPGRLLRVAPAAPSLALPLGLGETGGGEQQQGDGGEALQHDDSSLGAVSARARSRCAAAAVHYSGKTGKRPAQSGARSATARMKFWKAVVQLITSRPRSGRRTAGPAAASAWRSWSAENWVERRPAK